jgi:dTMP kinase
VLVVEITGTSSQLALFAQSGLMMARLLPSVVVGPVAGVVADRYDRKRLMAVTAACRGLIFLLLAASAEVWSVFALVFLVECLTLMFISAKDASLPVMVRRDQLQPASQLNLLATFGPFPVGAAIASLMGPLAALLQSAGFDSANQTVFALVVNGGLLLVASLLLSRLSLPPHGQRTAAEEPAPGPQGLWAELHEGLAFIRHMPLVRSLILGVVGVFFGAGVIVALGPVFVTESLGGQSTDWYVTMASVGLGLAAGLALVPLLTRRVARERIFPVTLLATGVIATVIALLQHRIVALGLALGLGAAVGLGVVLGYTLLQEHTEDHVRGKTFAAFYTSTRISMFAALALAPALAGFIGTGTLILGDWGVQASGVRIMIFLAGLVVTGSALGTLRGMWRWLRGAHVAERPLTLDQLATLGTTGVFVVFEGVEGAGKSTQVVRLAETLRAEGYDVLVTREPGGAPIAERIRGLLLDTDTGPMEPHTEALLLAAARAEHFNKTILPALEQGRIVLCDRFIDSSLAYQGYARGLGPDNVLEINRWAIGGPMPDVTVLLNLDADEGLARVSQRPRGDGHIGPVEPNAATDGDRGDRMERELAQFHRWVAEGYRQLAARENGRFVVVDARADPGEIAAQVRAALHPWLPAARDAAADERPGTAGAADNHVAPGGTETG